jgi:ABC-type nitrate/sulfonate/bicarbonate transport system permease component
MKTVTNFLLSPRVIQIAFVLLLLLCWHLVTVSGSVSPLFLPPLNAVYEQLVALISAGTVLEALGTTLRTVAIAYSISLTLGVLTGFAVTQSRYLSRLFEPLFASVFAIPLTLLFPLFLLFFGIGPESKMAYGATYSFFPIVLNTISGLSHVDARFIASARSMGASRALLFRRVQLPGALPVILSGLRVGFFICFAAVLGGETLSSVSGLGHEIASAAQLMESARMFAWILVVIATASVLVVLAGFAERGRRDLQRGGSA